MIRKIPTSSAQAGTERIITALLFVEQNSSRNCNAIGLRRTAGIHGKYVRKTSFLPNTCISVCLMLQEVLPVFISIHDITRTIC